MRFRRHSVLGAAVAALVTTGLLPGLVGAAQAATDPATLGTSADTAAASCWEIKQVRPTATDGAYWLVTPQLPQPQQFYCDMTTNGGGWVLVGKGRDGWTDSYAGKGDAAALQTPGLATMSSTTTELSARTIDALLGGQRVDALTDGIRVRRATNTAGTSWQEVRMRLDRRDRWTWTFGAEHPMRTWAFDTRTGSGGAMPSFGQDTTYQRMVTTPQDSQNNRWGFAYGTKVAGSSSATSYLWSYTNNGGGAIPYSQVYLRPQLTSSSFTPIADSGTSAFSMPAVVKSKALESPWGVAGIAGNQATEGNIEVQAFTQSGNNVYVGGNFATVQQDGSGTGSVSQPFLAAFDVTTGEWVSSFRPQLNEQVHALTTLPDGSIVAGGEFTQANGQPTTQIVDLDPTTGATMSNFNLSLTTSTGAPVVRTLDVQDGWLYVGGAFTKLSGGTPTKNATAGRLGRVSVTDGRPDLNWNPKLNGTVNDVDASSDGQAVYAVGYFSKAGTVAAFRAAAISTAAGAPLAPAFAPTWSNSNKNYQRTVQQVGDQVYIGGSEHSLFGFRRSDMARVSGSITKKHGDIQAISSDGQGVIYAGCHCFNYSYENAYTWSSLSAGWTEADAMDWVGAWDAATGKRLPDFLPEIGSRQGSGVWAIMTDSRGNLWVGGDLNKVTTKSTANKWAGGFVRFDPSDSTPPATPGNLQVVSQDDTTVTLSWSKVTDAGGGVYYQVLRDDRPIAVTSGNTTTITVPKGGLNRFFVRAADAAGNRSASTPVLTLG